ncbi:hypothetical protein [Bacillus sp. 1A]|uniref:hypothetical protein n=1 Tax=Bacillus sp. 1A TaxID=3461399 RepID=UPI004044FEC4
MFAEFIVNEPMILEQLLESKYIHKWKTVPNMVGFTESIAKIGKEKGIQYINIENWPVLIWIYNLIKRTPEFMGFNKLPKFKTLSGETSRPMAILGRVRIKMFLSPRSSPTM